MYNKKHDVTIIATTPFAFGEEEGSGHGLTVTCEVREAEAEFFGDIIGKEQMAILGKNLSSDSPIDGRFALKFIKKPCRAEFGKSAGVDAEITSVEVGDGVRMKVKMGNVTEKSMGQLCSLLRKETTLKLIVTQTEMEL